MMSVVLTFMVWNFSPDLNNIDSTDSKKSNTKTIGKPMSANIENVISPYQIVEVKGDKVKGSGTISCSIVSSNRYIEES